jgi:hypothetical protein
MMHLIFDNKLDLRSKILITDPRLLDFPSLCAFRIKLYIFHFSLVDIWNSRWWSGGGNSNLCHSLFNNTMVSHVIGKDFYLVMGMTIFIRHKHFRYLTLKVALC